VIAASVNYGVGTTLSGSTISVYVANTATVFDLKCALHRILLVCLNSNVLYLRVRICVTIKTSLLSAFHILLFACVPAHPPVRFRLQLSHTQPSSLVCDSAAPERSSLNSQSALAPPPDACPPRVDASFLLAAYCRFFDYSYTSSRASGWFRLERRSCATELLLVHPLLSPQSNCISSTWRPQPPPRLIN
jgi:hypothetical protein